MKWAGQIRFVFAAMVVASLSAWAARRPAEVVFQSHMINAGAFETTAVGDINHDGHPDIVSGENWYEGPRWIKHNFRSIEYFRNATEDLTDLLVDVNGDGYLDVVSSASHGNRIWWNENPKGKPGPWKEHRIESGHSIEFSFLVTLDTSSKTPAVLPQWGGHTMTDPLAWFEITNGGAVKHVVSPRSYGHGIGVADLNGDGRNDIITPLGWLEAPPDPRSPNWTLHEEFNLGSVGYVYAIDVNKDGRIDLVTTAAHDYGVFWMENMGGGKWLKHVIDDPSPWIAAIGPAFDLSKLPATAKLLADVLNDQTVATGNAKEYFRRKFPVAAEMPADYGKWTCDEGDRKPASRPLRSYPSGHATMSYTFGVVLAELMPEKAQAILARSADYAYSREVCGDHYHSDVEAGHVLGTTLGSLLLHNDALKPELEAARQELKQAQLTK